MYPVSYEADYEGENRNRLTVFLRHLIVIPWAIVAALYAIVAQICALIAWFAIVFTGGYPEGLYNFNAGFLRLQARINGFYYLLTDAYPPFNGQEDPAYPIRVGVPPPLDIYNRVKTGFRLIIGIPVMLLALVQSLIVGVCSFIAWFAILFTGRLPQGLYEPIRSGSAYLTRAGAYFFLLTEDYPPFALEEGASEPAGAIERETTPPPSA